MTHVIEPAASGRSKCRACGQRIAKDELRFGERLPNPFADEGEMTLWFHLTCAAYRRPEPLLETLAAGVEARIDQRESLEAEARRSLEHRRLPRIDGAQRDPSGRAKCRSCRETIAKGEWRIRLVFFEQGRFEPGGFIHVGCAPDYFETDDFTTQVLRFSGDLSPAEAAELERALTA